MIARIWAGHRDPFRQKRDNSHSSGTEACGAASTVSAGYLLWAGEGQSSVSSAQQRRAARGRSRSQCGDRMLGGKSSESRHPMKGSTAIVTVGTWESANRVYTGYPCRRWEQSFGGGGGDFTSNRSPHHRPQSSDVPGEVRFALGLSVRFDAPKLSVSLGSLSEEHGRIKHAASTRRGWFRSVKSSPI